MNKHRYWTDDALRQAVAATRSRRDVLFRLLKDKNKSRQGYYFRLLRDDIARLNLDMSHFTQAEPRRNRSNEEIFAVDSGADSDTLKRRLVDNIGWKYECSVCKSSTWMEKPLSLHIDHINGSHSDNRIENLRLLCPNCHSQTPTYCGKNAKRVVRRLAICKCGAEIKTKSGLACAPCSRRAQGEKTVKADWPDTETLIKAVWDRPVKEIAKELGISDSAFLKYVKRRGVKTPPRGHWAKIRAKSTPI